MGFVANFLRFPAMQKLWESIKSRQSYSEFKDGNFLRHSVDSVKMINGAKYLGQRLFHSEVIFQTHIQTYNCTADRMLLMATKWSVTCMPALVILRQKCTLAASCRSSRFRAENIFWPFLWDIPKGQRIQFIHRMQLCLHIFYTCPGRLCPLKG